MNDTPRVPDVTGLNVREAALAYAAAGLYVGPLKHRSKSPGSVLGDDWPVRTSRDPDVIRRWFPDGTGRGVFLHCGRSGLLVFDVDKPENLHPLIDFAVSECRPPWQNTRPAQPDRRHYLFGMPAGRMLGNSVGKLGKGWGEVRGDNGVIVVAPSEHKEPDSEYAWGHVGPVPVLPDYLADQLPDALHTADAASDVEVEQFIDKHDTGDRTLLLDRLVAGWRAKVEQGESRHDSMTGHLTGALKEAAAGCYPARLAVEALETAFLDAVTVDGHGPHQAARRSPEEAAEEWNGLLSWAVAQARVADPADTLARAAEYDRPTAEDDFADPWVHADQLARAEARLAAEVEREAHRLRVRQAAHDLLAAERLAAHPIPELLSLTDFLAEPDEETPFRVDGLWPVDGRVVFSAQFKAGKTTTVANLLRSLVDGDPFLGQDVEQVGRVVLVDNELSPGMIRRWLRDQGIRNTSAVELVSLRGRLSAFNVLEPTTRARWAEVLGPADVLVFDPLRPALDALGLSEDKDAGRFLEALDELVVGAGIRELVVVHHMGHSGERSRGDSRILDWPDAVWKLVREDDDPGSARYFSAHGRDVDFPESRLAYDADTRHLSLDGRGSRKEAQTSDLKRRVLALVRSEPGCSQTAIEQGVGGRRDNVRATIRELLAKEVVRVEEQGQKRLHYAVDEVESE